MNSLIIREQEGYTPQISYYLLSMMNYARHITLATVRGLSLSELDYIFDKESNTIGSLLLHIAAIEYSYQKNTFEGRKLNANEKLKWSMAINLGITAQTEIKGNELSLNHIETVQTSRR